MLVKEWASRDHGRVGNASGMIYALGTLGGLCGIFVSSFFLVPGIGSRDTLIVTGILVSLLGILILFLERGKARGVTTMSLFLGIAAVSLFSRATYPFPKPWGNSRLIWETESPYQFVRVVMRGQGGLPVYMLQLNEGLDSFHSVRMGEKRGTTGGKYYDAICLAFLFRERRKRPARILSLGCAGGTCLRLLEEIYGRDCSLSLEGVEIDNACIKAGRRYLGLPGNAIVRENVDARVFVRCSPKKRYDFVILDAYSSQIYIPFHLCTREFFRELRGILAPGGVVAMNVSDPSGSGLLLNPIAQTLANVFKESMAFKVPLSRNFLVVARREGRIDPFILNRVPRGNPLERLGKALSLPGAWKRFARKEGRDLTDFHCPIESLTWDAYSEAMNNALGD